MKKSKFILFITSILLCSCSSEYTPLFVINNGSSLEFGEHYHEAKVEDLKERLINNEEREACLYYSGTISSKVKEISIPKKSFLDEEDLLDIFCLDLDVNEPKETEIINLESLTLTETLLDKYEEQIENAELSNSLVKPFLAKSTNNIRVINRTTYTPSLLTNDDFSDFQLTTYTYYDSYNYIFKVVKDYSAKYHSKYYEEDEYTEAHIKVENTYNYKKYLYSGFKKINKDNLLLQIEKNENNNNYASFVQMKMKSYSSKVDEALFNYKYDERERFLEIFEVDIESKNGILSEQIHPYYHVSPKNMIISLLGQTDYYYINSNNEIKIVLAQKSKTREYYSLQIIEYNFNNNNFVTNTKIELEAITYKSTYLNYVEEYNEKYSLEVEYLYHLHNLNNNYKLLETNEEISEVNSYYDSLIEKYDKALLKIKLEDIYYSLDSNIDETYVKDEILLKEFNYEFDNQNELTREEDALNYKYNSLMYDNSNYTYPKLSNLGSSLKFEFNLEYSENFHANFHYYIKSDGYVSNYALYIYKTVEIEEVVTNIAIYLSIEITYL